MKRSPLILVFPSAAIILFLAIGNPNPPKPPMKTALQEPSRSLDSQSLQASAGVWEKCIQAGYHLYDQTGEEFDVRSLVGKPVVISFFEPRCSPTDVMVQSAFARLRKQHDNNVVFISMTLFDGNDLLADYASQFRAGDERWAFVTAKDSTFQIYKLLFPDVPDQVGHWLPAKVGMVSYIAPSGYKDQEFFLPYKSEEERLNRFLTDL